MENSIVFDGAYPNAVIQSKISEIKDKDSKVLKVLEGKEKLSENDVIIGYSTNGSYNLLYKQSQEKGGTEQMDETEVQATEPVEVPNDTETQAVEASAVETPEVTPTDTVETQSENNTVEETPVVENDGNTVENETMYSEKEILDKFDNISTDLNSLIQLAKEGLANRNETIEQALKSGVRAMGNAFNKEIFEKTFSNMATKDIKDMGNAWETQVKEKFSDELISKQDYKNKNSIEVEVEVDYSNYKTLGY